MVYPYTSVPARYLAASCRVLKGTSPFFASSTVHTYSNSVDHKTALLPEVSHALASRPFTLSLVIFAKLATFVLVEAVLEAPEESTVSAKI